MSENEPVQVQDDEIDLIDLFVVLLRYRKMIIGLTLLSIIGAGLLYFWWPLRQYDEALEKQKMEAELILNTSPVARQFGAGSELLQLLRKPDMIYQAMGAAGYEEIAFTMPVPEDADPGSAISLNDPAQRSKAYYLIQERIIGNRGANGESLEPEDRIYLASGEAGTITLRAWARDPQRARNLLITLKNSCEIVLVEILRPFAKSVVDSYDRLLAIDEPSAAVDSAIKQGSAQYDAAQRILTGEEVLFSSLGGVSIYEKTLRLASFRSDMMVKAVVIVMATFFLSVFLAFLRNAVRQVKQNDESMAKIRGALRKNDPARNASGRSQGQDSGKARV